MQEKDLIYCICEDCAEAWEWKRRFIFYNIKDICELCGEEGTPVMDQVFWEERQKEIMDDMLHFYEKVNIV